MNKNLLKLMDEVQRRYDVQNKALLIAERRPKEPLQDLMDNIPMRRPNRYLSLGARERAHYRIWTHVAKLLHNIKRLPISPAAQHEIVESLEGFAAAMNKHFPKP